MANSNKLLTVKGLQAVKPEQRGEIIRDGGGLRGIVACSAIDGFVSISFSYRFRVGNRTREKRLGTWPATELSAIRAERDRLRLLVGQGIDPIELEQQQRDAEEQAIAAKQQAAQQAAARMTFKQLFEMWHQRQLKDGRKDGGKEIVRSFEKDVLPKIGILYVDEIKRQQIAALLHEIVQRGSGRMANLTLSNLRQCFGWAIGAGLLENDPTSHLKKESFGGKETERDRVLSDEELRLLLQERLPTCNLSLKANAAVRVLLSTAARVSELLKARREHIDLSKREWFLPDTKNGKPHLIHLSDFAVEAMSELLSIIDNPIWVFPDRSGQNHVCEKTLTKQIGDRQRDGRLLQSGRSRDMESLLLPNGRWTPHDLRRTAATLMGDLGVRPDVIERCLNHVDENKVRRTYQRQAMLEERMKAFQLLGNRLALYANKSAGNVVPLVA